MKSLYSRTGIRTKWLIKPYRNAARSIQSGT